MVRLKDKIKSVVGKKKGGDESIIEEDFPPGLEEQMGIEEAEGEFVLLKIFERENPDIGFSYAATKIEELKKLINSLKVEVDSLNQTNSKLRMDLERVLPLKGAVEDLKKDLEEKDNDIFAKDLDVKKLNKTIDRLQGELEELRNDLKEKEQQLEKGQERIKQLEDTTKLEELEAEVSRLKVITEEQKDVVVIKSTQLEEYKQVAMSQEGELSSLKATWWQQGKDLKKIKAELEEKSGILTSKETLIEELTKRSNSLGDAMEAMKGELVEKERKLTGIEEQMADVDGQRKKTEGQLLEKETALGRITGDLGAAQARVDDLKRQLDERDSQLYEAKIKVRDLEDVDKVGQMEAELSRLNASIAEQKDIMELKTSEADTMKQAAMAQEDELSTLKATWWGLDKQIKKMKPEIEEKTQLLKAKDALVEELKKKTASLNDMLESTKKELDSKGGMASKYEDNLGILKGKLGALKITLGMESGMSDKLTIEQELDKVIEVATVKIGSALSSGEGTKELEDQIIALRGVVAEKEAIISQKDEQIAQLSKGPVVASTPTETVVKAPDVASEEKLKLKKELRILELEKKTNEKLMEKLLSSGMGEKERSIREKRFKKKLDDLSIRIDVLREKLEG